MIRGPFSVLCLLLLTACSQEQQADCGFVSDQATVIRTEEAGPAKYYLVKRISGFQDKVISFEVYGAGPSFDSCGSTTAVLLASNSVEFINAGNQAQYPAAVELTGEPAELQIDYAQGDDPDWDKTLTFRVPKP